MCVLDFNKKIMSSNLVCISQTSPIELHFNLNHTVIAYLFAEYLFIYLIIC